MKISELRPCDNCGDKIFPLFYVIRFSLAIFKRTETQQFIGMTTFFSGNLRLAEIMSGDDVVKVAMDDPESSTLKNEIYLCSQCYANPVCLAELAEKACQTEFARS